MQPRMTSVHMNTNDSQATTPTSTINGATNNNQVQTNTSRYDESERVRKHREELWRHHTEAKSIHQRIQPMLDDDSRQDTLKLTAQINGTKGKNAKPKATKRQRPSTSSSNNSANTSISTTINNNNVINKSQVHTPMGAIGANNGVQHHQHLQPPQQQAHTMLPPHSQPQHIIQQQAPPQAQPVMSTGMQPMHHVSSYSPHQTQPSMHPQQQRHTQPSQMQPSHSYNDPYTQPNQYQSQPIYPQRHQMPPSSHTSASQPMHFMNQSQQQQHYYAQQDHQSFYQSQPMMNGSHNHHHYNSLPNDLDLNIQAGLECDIDSLIKHEVSIEGQLNFNPDLFRLIDDHYDHHHHNHHHQPNHQ